MSQRTKLVVAYLGTSFHGWQRQRALRTVQGELEDALVRATAKKRVAIVGAGRTDAGVHAAGQVAHADLAARVPPQGLIRALNRCLPPEIRVRQVEPVQSSFHARRSAKAKTYVYRACWSAPDLPWKGIRSAVVRRPVSWQRLEEAVAMLPGRRDMGSFSVPDPEQEASERELYRVELRRREAGLSLTFVGDGFLRYQVRRMVGAALEVGWRSRSLGSLGQLLAEARPGSHIWTAPARGLTLEKVHYRRIRVVDSVLANGEGSA